MKKISVVVILILLLVPSLVYSKEKVNTPSNQVTKEILDSEIAKLKLDSSQKQLDDYKENTRIILTLQGFLITLLLGGIGYLAVKVYRFDKDAKEIREEAEKYSNQALNFSNIAHSTADEILRKRDIFEKENIAFLEASRNQTENLFKEMDAKFNEKLREVEILAGQAKASEESAKKSKDITELYSEGKRYYDNDDYAKAIDIFNKIIDLDPNNIQVRIDKGLALEGADNYKEAVDTYEQVNKIQPDKAIAYSFKGNALRELNDFENSLKAHDKALELEPNDSTYLCFKGNTLLAMGNYTEALNLYNRVIELDPAFSYAYYCKGRVLEKTNKAEEAKYYFSKYEELEKPT